MAIDVVGSKLKANAGYGQNGSNTPAAVPVRYNTKNPAAKSALSRGVVIERDNAQTRVVSAAPLAPAFGHRNRSHEGGTVPPNSRPVTKPAKR